jgi:hypothetical protein
MKALSSLVIAVALLCRTVVSDPLSPAKPTASLRGATSEQASPVSEVGRGSRELQYADQTCYQKDYSNGGTYTQEVACSQIMGSCRGIETACDDTFADALRDAEASPINSWFVWFNSSGETGCQWEFTVCS